VVQAEHAGSPIVPSLVPAPRDKRRDEARTS